MLPPDQDTDDRMPIWDSMQMLWMDVDPKREMEFIAKCCARSKYSVSELERIYWNEVFPAVSFNLRPGNFLPEWTGFKQSYLRERVAEADRFGRGLPVKCIHPYAFYWWRQVKTKVQALRRVTGV